MRAGSVREVAAIKGAQGCSGHRTGTCAYRAAGQLASDRAVPARQGDQIAAAINGHQPGGPGKRRQIRPSGMAGIGHMPRIPRHTDCQTWHARRASRPNLSALVIRQQIRDTSVSASIESRWWW
jgi:hypothetical protein